MKELFVAKIGVIAAETLAEEETGSVIGVTSKGAFLRAGMRIIFITSADYRSPFNLTLINPDHSLEELEPGEKVVIQSGELSFPKAGLAVHLRTAEVWTPNAPAPLKSVMNAQITLLERWVEVLRKKDAEKGYLFLAETGNNGNPKIRNAAENLVISFREQRLDEFLAASTVLLGSGTGLTPSGDDFLTGFFLYQTRLDQATGQKREFVSTWCDELIKLAFQKTTTISANRLAAARRGWSEELFLHIIDALFNPSVEISERYLDRLMNFGHSSGVDTLMGIYFAVKSLL